MLLSLYNPPEYPPMVQSRGYETAREYEALFWLPDQAPSPAVDLPVIVGGGM
jgi:hypothetical protein